MGFAGAQPSTRCRNLKRLPSPEVSGKMRIMAVVSQLPRRRIKQSAKKNFH
jgi:hypothetical protein